MYGVGEGGVGLGIVRVRCPLAFGAFEELDVLICVLVGSEVRWRGSRWWR